MSEGQKCSASPPLREPCIVNKSATRSYHDSLRFVSQDHGPVRHSGDTTTPSLEVASPLARPDAVIEAVRAIKKRVIVYRPGTTCTAVYS